MSSHGPAILPNSPLYEVLFLFSAPQGYLAEIKRLDQPADAPKSQVYQWLWLQVETVTTLRLVAMATSPRQQRNFKEALLWFDETRGELQWLLGPLVPLIVETDKSLPATLARLMARGPIPISRPSSSGSPAP